MYSASVPALLLSLAAPTLAAVTAESRVELIPGKKLWLKGNQTEAVGGVVPLWRDVSGTGHDALAASVGEPPLFLPSAINGLPAIGFTGTESFTLPDILGGSDSGQVFSVLRITGTDATLDGLWMFGEGATRYSDADGVSENFGFNIPDALWFSLLPNFSLTTWHAYEVQSDFASGWAQLFNGMEYLRLTFGEGDDQYLGFTASPTLGFNGESFFSGDIAEVLVFDAVLSPARRDLVNGYLKSKYDLPGMAGTDTDGDGLSDDMEISIGTSPGNPDTDGDGLDDGVEIARGTNPLVADAPSNPDDINGNSLSDVWELSQGWLVFPWYFEPGHGANDDPDGDGLTNAQEWAAGKNPNVVDSTPPPTDTDGDGIPDADEVSLTLTDPSNAHTAGDPDYDDSYGAKGYAAIERWSGFTSLPSLDAFRESAGVNDPVSAGLTRTRTLTKTLLVKGTSTSGGVIERVRGWITPHVSGEYTFNLELEDGAAAGAGEALLRLSTDNTPFLAVDCLPSAPTAGTRSTTVVLEAGKSYYYELWLRKPDATADARLDFVAATE